MGKNPTNSYKTATDKIPSVNVSYRDGYRDKEGKSTVQLIVYLQSKRIVFNSGVKVRPEHWDAENHRIKKSHTEAKDLNLIINTSKAKLNNIFVKYRLQDKELTPDILKEEYERPTMAFDFLEWMEKAIDERRGEASDSSIKQFKAHLNKLKLYKNSVAFAELSEEFFTKFNRYMMVTLKNESNTRWNTLKTFRTFINIAKRKGVMDFNPLDHMPVKRAQTDRIFLDEKELQTLLALYRKQTLPENYQCVLRHFLFSCFTGLRISDLKAVRMEDIISNTLILVPQKTKKTSNRTVRIPLKQTALELIKDESPYRVKGLIFATYSEQRMRTYLKDIIGHAKIKKDVTFHSGRHTFATLFLKKTNNLAALQKLLGHQNINQTMVYAHILSDDIEREMDVFDNV
jgi:integrase